MSTRSRRRVENGTKEIQVDEKKTTKRRTRNSQNSDENPMLMLASLASSILDDAEGGKRKGRMATRSSREKADDSKERGRNKKISVKLKEKDDSEEKFDLKASKIKVEIKDTKKKGKKDTLKRTKSGRCIKASNKFEPSFNPSVRTQVKKVKVETNIVNDKEKAVRKKEKRSYHEVALGTIEDELKAIATLTSMGAGMASPKRNQNKVKKMPVIALVEKRQPKKRKSSSPPPVIEKKKTKVKADHKLKVIKARAKIAEPRKKTKVQKIKYEKVEIDPRHFDANEDEMEFVDVTFLPIDSDETNNVEVDCTVDSVDIDLHEETERLLSTKSIRYGGKYKSDIYGTYQLSGNEYREGYSRKVPPKIEPVRQTPIVYTPLYDCKSDHQYCKTETKFRTVLDETRRERRKMKEDFESWVRALEMESVNTKPCVNKYLDEFRKTIAKKTKIRDRFVQASVGRLSESKAEVAQQVPSEKEDLDTLVSQLKDAGVIDDNTVIVYEDQTDADENGAEADGLSESEIQLRSQTEMKKKLTVPDVVFSIIPESARNPGYDKMIEQYEDENSVMFLVSSNGDNLDVANEDITTIKLPCLHHEGVMTATIPWDNAEGSITVNFTCTHKKNVSETEPELIEIEPEPEDIVEVVDVNGGMQYIQEDVQDMHHDPVVVEALPQCVVPGQLTIIESPQKIDIENRHTKRGVPHIKSYYRNLLHRYLTLRKAKLQNRQFDSVTGEIRCKSCCSTFSNRKSYRQHIIAKHTWKYRCPKCENVFRTAFLKLQHLRTLHRRKKMKCQICNRPFRFHSNLKKHELLHSYELEINDSVIQFIPVIEVENSFA